MEWKQLISNKRFGQEHKHAERHDDLSEFKRDYDRLIFSSAFRRLQNKTQVFPLPGSIFVHNLLTHSLEVASVGILLCHAQDHLMGSALAKDLIREMVFLYKEKWGGEYGKESITDMCWGYVNRNFDEEDVKVCPGQRDRS